MKLAFSKPTNGDPEQALLFARFRDLGYEGLQLKGGQYQRWIEDPPEFLAAWEPASGAASGLIAGGRLDEPGIAALRRLFAFGRAVRAERIVFCHGVSRRGLSAADIQGFAQTLSDLGAEALDGGLKLSLHHHYDQPVMHREDFDTFFSAAREGTVGLTVDTAHLVKSGITDIAGVVRDFASVIDNLHVKDYAGGEFRVLGEGDIDFRPVFAALRKIGYDGWLCADEESGSELLPAMAACRQFMRQRLAPG